MRQTIAGCDIDVHRHQLYIGKWSGPR